MADIAIIFQYPSDKRVTVNTLKLNAKIDDVLHEVVSGWPEGAGEKPEKSRVRLICMGQILSEGTKTLEGITSDSTHTLMYH
jgi:hypothetical protein